MQHPNSFADADIVRRCLDGDVSLFEVLIKRYERMVFAFALRKISDPGVAQDLSQETFLIAYENLSRLKDRSRFKSWLMGITANLVRDHYKRRKLAGLPDTFEGEFVGIDPLQSVEQNERHEMLFKAMSRLSERYRAVLVKRYIEGAEYGDIAHELGLSIGAVEVCMHRARKALAAALAGYMAEPERNPE